MKKKLLTTACILGVASSLMACGGTGDDVNNGTFDNLFGQENVVEMDDENDEDYEDETEETSNYQFTNLYDFSLNGQVYSFPVKLGDMINDNSLVYYGDVPDDYLRNYWNHVNLYDAKTDEEFGDLTLYKDNIQDDYSIEDAYVYKVNFEREDVEISGTKLVLYGGITFDSTPEEVMGVFGEPDEISESVSTTTYIYNTLDEGNEYFLDEGATFKYDKEGNMIEIKICHATDIMKEE